MEFLRIIVMGSIVLWWRPSPAEPVSFRARAEVCDGVIKALNSYIFPAVAERMKAEAEKQRPVYLSISDRDVLARSMTEDLRRVSQDKHLNVMAHSELPTEAPSAKTGESDAERGAFAAYGFYDVRRLPGNIGYIDLHSFNYGPDAAAYLSAVMTLAGDTDALIIDVRENHGGLPQMAEMMAGYLLGRRELIADVRERKLDGTFTVERRYSIPMAGGTRYTRPVYILTSHATFSAAEYFTYVLQSLGRAKVVGEDTGGGANSGDVFPLADGFSIFVPTGSIEGAVTHENWDGTGVQPNVKTTGSAALETAYRLALGTVKTDTLSNRESQMLKAALADPGAALKSSVQF
ncbi:MAG TPA: S41 family peptidase [Rhizomicrobium sp.]|jgi:hypothetical protein|nr:S41 family peptidase [Rhizomicrobium sp.]